MGLISYPEFFVATLLFGDQLVDVSRGFIGDNLVKQLSTTPAKQKDIK